MSSIMSAILNHGAQAPPSGPGGGGGLPPGLAAAIAQGGAPQSPDDGDQPEDTHNEAQLLTKIIEDSQHFMAVAADEGDKAVVAACLTQLQKLRAKDQQEQDGALGGKTSPRLMRKAAAAQGGANGGV